MDLDLTPALAPLLAALLHAAALSAQEPPVPRPEAVIGHPVGASGRLADWQSIVAYFDTLDAASPEVRVERIGESVQGRPLVMAVITSGRNQQRLEEIRRAQARLADPRGAPPDELERLVRTQPAVALVGASLHGDEVMATQMSMELAYELATRPDLRAALDSVVVLLVPGMNPDGLELTRDWWLRTRRTPYAGAAMPWLYHVYAGHDNNRDFFMLTQPETRAVTRVMYERWFPHLFYDVHQMGSHGARFFVPPFDDPLNPNLDPLLVRETNLVGTWMALELTAAGKTGVAHQGQYDLWWHGGARTVPARHNVVGILSEAASADYADPVSLPAYQLAQPEAGSMYPEPWPGGEWTPRDIVEYELVSSRALVRLLHRQRATFVGNFVRLAQRQVEAGRAGGPFAYLVPADQADPGSAAEMLRVLQRGGVEVHELRAPLRVAGRLFAAGTRVVLMAQPYRAHAKDLLEPQLYPELRPASGGPPMPPYDQAGWTLPLQMGVEVVEVERPFRAASIVRLDTVPLPVGAVAGSGPAYALDPRLNGTHRALHEALRDGGRVSFSAAPAGAAWPAGTPVVGGLPDLAERVRRWAGDWGVNAAAAQPPAGPAVERLRVALYKPWTASIDEGWTRWVFEQWGVPFDTVHDDRVRRGALGDSYDVVVVPDVTYEEIVRGRDPRATPPEYAGGLGEPGVRALRDFVQGGGTLVLLDSSVELAIRDLGVPVRDLEAEPDPDDEDGWYSPGSLLRVEWDTAHPLALGMPRESAVFYAGGPVLEVAPGAAGVSVVARYPEDDVLLSGYARGEDRVAGRAALVEARVGLGRAILFGFRPQHRGQTHDTFKPLFWSLLRR